ncbi:MAG TPA: phosphoribosyltransferase family protein [Prolixibacteraceae bacterium]|nr:phosphoribosyltransferase family protein [Prolixibacteraceae bacterium]
MKTDSDTQNISHKWVLAEYFDDFLSLIYPNLCLCCDTSLVKQEKYLCTTCSIHLPRSHYHLVENNPVEQLFWGRTTIEKATSFFIFQKGSRYQKLLHNLKYKGLREIGVELGRQFAAELLQNSYFDTVDILVPVPLHPKKERKRGYNQSTAIAEGLCQVLNKTLNTNNLYRKHYSETQTRKGRYERWENVNELFAVKNPDSFANKHILLIDDVVTTGSTLEACANALLQCENTKVSIATLAYAAI